MSIFQNDLRPTKREHANICDVFVIYASTMLARIIPDVVTLTATLLTLKYTALTGELSIAVWIILIHKNIFKNLLTTRTTTCQMAHRTNYSAKQITPGPSYIHVYINIITQNNVVKSYKDIKLHRSMMMFKITTYVYMYARACILKSTQCSARNIWAPAFTM